MTGYVFKIDLSFAIRELHPRQIEPQKNYIENRNKVNKAIDLTLKMQSFSKTAPQTRTPFRFGIW
jgi:hypothetical protein